MFLIRVIFILLLSLTFNVQSASRGIAMQTPDKKAQTPFEQGSYRALVIGNNEYVDSKGVWKSLKNRAKWCTCGGKITQ